ncbi:MAG: hypothetical protein ACKV2V_12740 [Blastocatellia bacterium]
MTSPQLHHLIEQIAKATQRGRMNWEPLRTIHGGRLYFRIGLGEGIVTIQADPNYDGSHHEYTIVLARRDGFRIDELSASPDETALYATLSGIYEKAREYAFNLNQLIDGMQTDLEAGRSRELPEEPKPEDEDIPF